MEEAIEKLALLGLLCSVIAACARPDDELRHLHKQLVLESGVCNTPSVGKLINDGAPFTIPGSLADPLAAAIEGRCDDTVELLLSKRAPISLGLLHRAAAGGSETIARLLLERGADPNAKDGAGMTPLMAASHDGRVSVITLLLGSGAHINLRSYAGLSALDYTGNDAECLRRRGILTFSPSNDPDWADRRQSAARLLLSRGARGGCRLPVPRVPE